MAHGHMAKDCSNNWHCKACFKYGHKARLCLTRAQPRILWAPKPVKPITTDAPADVDEAQPPLDLGASISEATRKSHKSPSSPSYSATSSLTSQLSHRPSTPPLSPTVAPTLNTMANFPCNLMLYTPAGMHVEHGWQHPARARVALGGEPPRRHEQFAILELEPGPVPAQVPDVVHFLQ
jgi:hypothetical protein